VNDLKKTKGTEITFKNIAVSAKGSAEEIKKAKLKGHGIIAKNKDGKLVKIINGHNYGKKEIQLIIDQLLAQK